MKRGIVPAALMVLLAVGCAVGEEAAPDESLGEAEVRASSCTEPTRYFATFRTPLACKPVTAARGTWSPEVAFPSAPASVRASTCAYRWTGARHPDRQALEDALGVSAALAPSCGAGASPSAATAHAIPMLDMVGQAGAVGCDVCGKLVDRRLWVILPAERLRARQFAVGLSNGQSQAFQLDAPAGARAVEITLPPPPAGATWTPGNVTVY